MKKLLIRLIAACSVSLCLLAQSGSALDKTALAGYVRYLMMWPASAEISVSDPTPAAAMPGYNAVTVKATLGGQSQQAQFFVSPDGQTIVRGEAFNLKKSPFDSIIKQIDTSDQPFLGTPGAPVTVVEFADFQCPYCRQESDVIRHKLLEAYPKDVQIFYLDYPIDASHPYARGAAVFGRCVYRQNSASFWNYYDWAFAHQDELSAANFREKAFAYAKGDKNLDIDQLTACSTASAPRQEVDHTKAIGDALGIEATPSLYVNGRLVVGAVPFDELKRVIDREIEWVKTAKAGETRPADCCSVTLSLPGMGK